MTESTDRWYPDEEDIITAHEQIVSNYPETDGGVRDRGAIEYAVSSVRNGPMSDSEPSIHDEAFQFMRLLVVNHPFVDGNKRTALAVVTTFYLLNGLQFDYDHEVRTILKSLGTDESGVDESEVVSYLRDHTTPVDFEDVAAEWRDELVDFGLAAFEDADSEPHRNG